MIYRAIIKMWILVEHLYKLKNDITFSERPSRIHQSGSDLCDTFQFSSVAQLCTTLLAPHGLQPTRLLCPWDSPGKSTGVGGHALLQGVFPTQG